MPDFIRRFGELGADGQFVLSSSRQSIITSLLSAGCVGLNSFLFSGVNVQ
jgi:hypothetical protein